MMAAPIPLTCESRYQANINVREDLNWRGEGSLLGRLSFRGLQLHTLLSIRRAQQLRQPLLPRRGVREAWGGAGLSMEGNDAKAAPAPEEDAEGKKCPLCLENKRGDGFVAPTGPACTHQCCRECLRLYLLVGLKDVSKYPMTCFAPDCQQPLQYTEVSRTLTRLEVRSYDKFHLRATLRQDPSLGRLVDCPWPGCSNIMVAEAEGKTSEQKLQCSGCRQYLCSLCGVKWHAGQTCQQYTQSAAALAEQDLGALALQLVGCVARAGCGALCSASTTSFPMCCVCDMQLGRLSQQALPCAVCVMCRSAESTSSSMCCVCDVQVGWVNKLFHVLCRLSQQALPCAVCVMCRSAGSTSSSMCCVCDVQVGWVNKLFHVLCRLGQQALPCAVCVMCRSAGSTSSSMCCVCDVQVGWVKCPRCGALVERIDGCYHLAHMFRQGCKQDTHFCALCNMMLGGKFHKTEPDGTTLHFPKGLYKACRVVAKEVAEGKRAPLAENPNDPDILARQVQPTLAGLLPLDVMGPAGPPAQPPDLARYWQTSLLWGCCDDGVDSEQKCKTWCCPCYMYGQSYQQLYGGSDKRACCVLCCCWPLAPCAFRYKIRQLFGIRGCCLIDLLAVVLCPCLSALQSARELNARAEVPVDMIME
eukprot:g14866.t1